MTHIAQYDLENVKKMTLTSYRRLRSEKVAFRTGQTYVIEKYPYNSSNWLHLNSLCCCF